MGGGGLRLLPHKSWNVWNYDNREKVRRDEAQAQADEDERRVRGDAADQEVRLAVLRARAAEKHPRHTADDDCATRTLALAGPDAAGHGEIDGLADGPGPQFSNSDSESYPALESGYPELGKALGSDGAVAPAAGGSGHINFFEDVERGKNRRNGKNAAKEAERKQDEIKQLKKIGALVFLGQTVSDNKAGPWYAKPGATQDEREAAGPNPRATRRHVVADPMVAMKQHVSHKEKKVAADRRNAAVTAGPSGSAAAHLQGERARREQQARAQVEMLYRRPATPLDSTERAGYSGQQGYRHYTHTGPHPGGAGSAVQAVASGSSRWDRPAKRQRVTSDSDGDGGGRRDSEERRCRAKKEKKRKKDKKHKSKKHKSRS